MGITLFTDGDRKYYRVTKAWNGKEHQVYVRIGKSEKRALKEAEKVDADLEQRRNAFHESQKLSGDGLIHEDGKIIGLQLQTRLRDGRKPCTEFKIRIKEPKKAAKFKSVSVTAYGLEAAFKVALARVCELRDISPTGIAYEKMLGTFPKYQEEYIHLSGEEPEGINDANLIASPTTSAVDQPEKNAGFLDQLKGSLQDFLRSRAVPGRKK